MKVCTDVTDEFEGLNEFIIGIGNSAKTTSETDFQLKKSLLEKVCAKLKEIITVRIFSYIERESLLKTYIGNLQVSLTDISDDCYLRLKECKHTKTSLLDLSCAEINNVFQFLSENYPRGFNSRLKAPDALKNQISFMVSGLLKGLELTFQKHNTEESLAVLILEYCQMLEDQTEEKSYTFHQLYYLHLFITTLNDIAEGNPEDFSKKLYAKLFYLNFNSVPFIQFYLDQIQKDYDRVESYRDELFQETIHLRSIQQYMVKADCTFDPGGVSLTEMFCSAIEKEIICIKKLQRIHVKTLGKGNLKMMLNPFYFRISISMEQFLFLFRILIEKGIVMVKRKIDLYEFINNHVGTGKKDHLSIGNMQNTYSEKRRITAIKVKETLLLMVKHIDEDYLTYYLIICFVFPE